MPRPHLTPTDATTGNVARLRGIGVAGGAGNSRFPRQGGQRQGYDDCTLPLDTTPPKTVSVTNLT